MEILKIAGALVTFVGSLFLFLTFVQGGQTLLWQVAKTETEKSLVINSLGRKWELTYHPGSFWRGIVCRLSAILCDQFRWCLLGMDPDSVYLYRSGGEL